MGRTHIILQHWSSRGKAEVQNHQPEHLQQSTRHRGYITFWLNDKVIQIWYESATPNADSRGGLRTILILPSPLFWSLKGLTLSGTKTFV